MLLRVWMIWRRRRRQAPWLARLLGPGRAEVTCETCFDALDRYVELEHNVCDAESWLPGMQAHLEGCPACREEHDLLLEFVGRAGRMDESHDRRHR